MVFLLLPIIVLLSIDIVALSIAYASSNNGFFKFVFYINYYFNLSGFWFEFEFVFYEWLIRDYSKSFWLSLQPAGVLIFVLEPTFKATIMLFKLFEFRS